MHAGEDDAAIYCGGSVDDEWNWANASHGARVNCEFTRTCAGYLSDYYNSTSEYFTSKEETCPTTSFNQCTEWRHTIETCDTDLEKGNTTSTYTTDDTTGCEIIQTIALSYFVPRPHCTQHSNKPLLFRVSSLPSLLSLLLSDLVKMSFETSLDHGGYCFDTNRFITTNFFDQKAWDVTMVCELLSAHNVLASTVALY